MHIEEIRYYAPQQSSSKVGHTIGGWDTSNFWAERRRVLSAAAATSGNTFWLIITYIWSNIGPWRAVLGLSVAQTGF